METRNFGNTDLQVSEVGLGTWPLGGTEAGLGSYGPIEEKTAIATVRRYLDLGGNFIDSARGYGPSETYIGKALAGGGCDRETIVLASKTGRTKSWEDVPKIREELETTLRELQTEYVDLYQLHAPPEDAELRDRIIDEFETLKAEGKIRYIGASIKGPAVTDATVALSRSYIETARIDALQLIYSIFRKRNARVFDESAAAGAGLIIPGAKSPEQCEANMAIAELPDLPSELVKTLEQHEMENAANP